MSTPYTPQGMEPDRNGMLADAVRALVAARVDARRAIERMRAGGA